MTSLAIDPRARHRARRALVQALYAWQMTGAEFHELRDQFAPTDADDERSPPSLGGDGMRRADVAYFLDCLRGVMLDAPQLDLLFAPHLDRGMDRLDPVERGILRAGVYELKERLDVPARVVLDEWVALAKTFGATESYRYVNGVLDRVARQLRGAELPVAAGVEP